MTREYPKHPLVGVGVVVWRDDTVLLIRRGKAPRKGQWSLPGGLQEVGETVFEAGHREIREETGLDIAIGGIIDIVDSIEHDDDGLVRFHYTLIDIWAVWLAGEASAGSDAAAVRWVHVNALNDYDLWHETVRIIEAAAEQRAEAGHARNQVL